MDRLNINGWIMIGGPGRVVQVDEALIGRRKYHRGRAIEGTWVFGMVDDQGAVRMEVSEKRDKDTLQGSIPRNVLPGSIIHSDCWRAYHGLDALGYQHSTVNHSVEFVAQDGTHTQKIESQWHALRRMFSPGGRKHEDIADYLVKFLWRQKCRRDGLDPVDIWVPSCYCGIVAIPLMLLH